MKPRIFIGSSSEGLDVAKYIKNYLQDDFECYLWNDEIFQYNDSFFETLLREASLFDFGILIATSDDYSQKRGEVFESPRDNVLFEFGLFLGRLGSSRAFVIQEEGVELPSDLLGITLPSFKRANELKKSDSLNECCKRIQKKIEEKIQLGELSLLASTSLAIGYFNNFVSIVCESLIAKDEVTFDGDTFSDFEFNIVMPNDLDTDIKKRANIYYQKKDLKEFKIEAVGRSFPIYTTYDKSDSDTLKLFDMPSTLNGIDKAIELFMKKGHIGKSRHQKLLEERELHNFNKVLEILIKDDAYSRDIANIIEEDII